MQHLSALLVSGLLLCMLGTAGGCASTTPSAPEDLSLDALRNLAYSGVGDDGVAIQLTAGHWQGAPFDADSATAPTLDFAGDFVARGDVDGDGSADAVVVLHSWTGGSGLFSYIAVVSGNSGKPRNIASQLLGDRVQVRDVRIQGGRILVDLRGHGPDDPSCCPGLHMLQSWQWQGGALEERTGERASTRTSVAELEGSRWELVRWSADEDASAAPVVSLSYSQGRFTGDAGCNRFGASVQDGASAGQLVVGPGTSTRMACEEPRMEIENRFLRILPGVQSFRYAPGMLMMAYRREDGSGAELWLKAAAAP